MLTRVVKVGGSLFDLPDLPERIQRWFATQPPAHNVLLAGGGQLAKQIRTWNLMTSFDDATAHWMCVDLLSVTAQLLKTRLPDLGLIDDERVLRDRMGTPGATIFSPAMWLREREPKAAGRRLPWNWDVTSDSIAGRLAAVLPADELVLLKSSPPRDTADGLWDLTAAGYVDQFLPKLAAELPPVRTIDLRSPVMSEFVLKR
jgi:aspartokinase-like uncharacterized kinase